MRKEPIIFNEYRPFEHYERAQKLKKSADSMIAFGKAFPFAALPVGIICAVFNPLSMALFTLFGTFFTALAVTGCNIRRVGLCLAAIPFAFCAAATLALSGSDFGFLGAALYLIAGIFYFRVMSAISDFNMLKELPGFPFFEHGLEDLSFAALEVHGAEEFTAEDGSQEPTERAKYLPIGPPSEDMPDLFTDGEGDMPALNVSEDVPETEEKSAYEKMANALPTDNGGVSDIDIFDF